MLTPASGVRELIQLGVYPPVSQCASSDGFLCLTCCDVLCLPSKVLGNMACTPAGNEAGAYLQFLIDHYDCLPQVREAPARAREAADT